MPGHDMNQELHLRRSADGVARLNAPSISPRVTSVTCVTSVAIVPAHA